MPEPENDQGMPEAGVTRAGRASDPLRNRDNTSLDVIRLLQIHSMD